MPSPNPGLFGGWLSGLAAISARDVWAVGTSVGWKRVALIEHWDGKTWHIVAGANVPRGDTYLSGIAAVSSHDLWAVGNTNNGYGHTVIEHWNGVRWGLVPVSSPGSLASVAAVSGQDIWAVGSGTKTSDGRPSHILVQHWDGTRWTTMCSRAPGASGGLLAVATVPTGAVWAVGQVVPTEAGAALPIITRV